jgi:hypothetical protein
VKGKTCKSGNKCGYAHASDELVTYKAKLCKSYGATGSCSFGGNCLFAHGVDELRTQKQSDVANGVCAGHAQCELSPLVSPRPRCSTASTDCSWSDVSSDSAATGSTVSVDPNGWRTDDTDCAMPALEDVKLHESHQWAMKELLKILDGLVLDLAQSSRRDWSQKYNERITAVKNSLGDGAFNGGDGFVRPARYWDQMRSSLLTLRDSLHDMDAFSFDARRRHEESLESNFWKHQGIFSRAPPAL